MKKRKRVARGFEILKLEDSFEEDFECLGSHRADDASSTLTDSASDDDWCIVDDAVGGGDAICSSSTAHGDENGVYQSQAWPAIRGGSSKERRANLKRDDIGARANKIVPVDDWISLCEPSTPDLAGKEVPDSVDNFAAKNTSEESEEGSRFNNFGQSDKPDPCADLVFQNDSARGLYLECVEFVASQRQEKEDRDVEFADSNLFAYVEISDSDSERKDSVAEEDFFEKEIFFPNVELPESEFAIVEVIPETDEGRGSTEGEVEPSDDHFRIEDESTDDDPEGYYGYPPCPDTLLENKCNEPENFLLTNDLYDFFPTMYCPHKFDRYGARRRKRQRLVYNRQLYLRKMLDHY